jgi:undecaprenyl-diphosphatase
MKKQTLSLWIKVLVASVPAGIIGVLFDDLIDGVLEKPFVIAATLILYGFLFLWLENTKRTPKFNNFSQMSYRTALLIGVFQMLALIPGTSRSGATILGAVFLGSSRFVAAEFSFFMAIPAMLGGSGIKLLKFALDSSEKYGSQYPALFSGLEWGVLLTGFFVAFIVSLIVIKFLLNYIKKHDFKVFGYYRIILGLLVLLYFGFIAR